MPSIEAPGEAPGMAEPPPQPPQPADEDRLALALDGEVRALLLALRGTTVEEMRFEREGLRIALHRALPSEEPSARAAAAPGTATPTADVASSTPGRTEVSAHMVGPFHRSREPDGPALANEGDHVEVGQALGVIETLGIATDVEASASGIIQEFLVDDGQPVEYGQALAIIASAAAGVTGVTGG
ncbi:MAG: acetyl-CoA carboxylase biotin carboxyl carrier protein [Chloroflexota bacterium]